MYRVTVGLVTPNPAASFDAFSWPPDEWASIVQRRRSVSAGIRGANIGISRSRYDRIRSCRQRRESSSDASRASETLPDPTIVHADA